MDIPNIRQRRRELGLTQWELARMVGVSITSIRQWEYKITTPKAENLIRLQEALKGEEGGEL